MMGNTWFIKLIKYMGNIWEILFSAKLGDFRLYEERMTFYAVISFK